jgi:excisionase family DNA binding protein
MVQGYYTLEEAAQILNVPTDELNQMRERKEIRAFADRGTWRFRTQDIEEMARRRGVSSDPEFHVVDHGKKASPESSDVFHFPLSDSSDEMPLPPLPGDSTEEVPIGRERMTDSSGKQKPSSHRAPRSPAPPPGSDSDVRLVADGSDVGFKVSSDSDVKLEEGKSSRVRPPSSKRRPVHDSGVRLVDDRASDSDVRIVPDSSGEIPLGEAPSIETGTESDVRLDMDVGVGSKRRGDSKFREESFVTEEIDLDAELRKAEEAARARTQQIPKPPSSRKVKGKTPPPASPFELSEVDLRVPPSAGSSTEGLARKIEEDSSDFDLTLDPSDSLSPLEPSSGEVAALQSEQTDDDALSDIDAPVVTGSSDSGINLHEPSDEGVSLEHRAGSSQDIDFEISVDKPKSSKRRKPSQPLGSDSSSEFELTLDDSIHLDQDDNVPTDSIRLESARLDSARLDSDRQDSGRQDSAKLDSGRRQDSGSVRRQDSARLDTGSSRRQDSARLDSKRQDSARTESARLAKDESSRRLGQEAIKDSVRAPRKDSVRRDSARLADSGRLVPTDEAEDKLTPADSGEDIFETDFEVPALEDESGSQVVPLDESDTDLESSDFDLALSDEDIATEAGDSGSQVVPLEEGEEVDEGAATVAKQRKVTEEAEEEAEGLVEEEGELAPRRRVVVPAAPADWGVFAPVTLMVSTLFLFFVGLMSIELLNGMWGFHQPNKASNIMIKAIGGLIPGVDSKDLEKD